tara:strand:- start:18614 stop:19642 length:1029 start_codon:yes stop_codon:yes gene_type:complete
MEFNIEYVRTKFDSRLIGLEDVSKVHLIQNEIKGLHNQSRISSKFFQSDYYSRYSKYDKYFALYKNIEEKNKRAFQIKHFSRIREEFRELDTKITGIEAGSLKKQDLESYVRLLAEHLDVHFAAYTLKNQKNNPHFCRFGCCRLAHNLDYNKIQYVLDNTENLNKLMKSNDYRFDDQHQLDWHSFTGSCWELIESGVAEVALEISNTMERLLLIPMGRYRTALNNVFVALNTGGGMVRNWSTTLWIKTMALLQLNKKEEAIYTLKRLVNIFEHAPVKQSYILHNRIVEACLLLYSLEKTIANKNKCEELFIKNAHKSILDETESTRERGLIVYEYLESIVEN